MLSNHIIEFITYRNLLKSNYRKGVHAFRGILSDTTLTHDWATSGGGVSLVFGTPIGKDDRNSAELREMALAHSSIDEAALTFLAEFYPEYGESWDVMAGDTARNEEIKANPLLWRTVSVSPVGMGKLVAQLAGLAVSEYTAMQAVAASSTAMEAVLASSTAMEAVLASSTAMEAVVASSTAMEAVVASSTAMEAVVASSTAMQAVAASSTAMQAVLASSTAINAIANDYHGIAAIYGNSTAKTKWEGTAAAVTATQNAKSSVIGKAAAKLAGQNPDSFADMSAVAASSTAMSAVAASSTAMSAVAASSTAMSAVAASSTAMSAVAASATAMSAVAASSTAMSAVAASSTAMSAVAASATAIRAMVASDTAKTALIEKNDGLQKVASTWWTTVQSGFTSVRAQRDDDRVNNADSKNEKYIMFAIPGGYNGGKDVTNCFHGHNSASAGKASGSYTDTTKRIVLLGGGTFTETGDGMVRTWVYSV